MNEKILRGKLRILFMSVLVLSVALPLSGCAMFAKLKAELWDKNMPDKKIDEPHRPPVNNP